MSSHTSFVTTLAKAIELLRTSKTAQVCAKDMAEDSESLAIKLVSDKKPKAPRVQPQNSGSTAIVKHQPAPPTS